MPLFYLILLSCTPFLTGGVSFLLKASSTPSPVSENTFAGEGDTQVPKLTSTVTQKAPFSPEHGVARVSKVDQSLARS
jgi:hypothetical protein